MTKKSILISTISRKKKRALQLERVSAVEEHLLSAHGKSRCAVCTYRMSVVIQIYWCVSLPSGTRPHRAPRLSLYGGARHGGRHLWRSFKPQTRGDEFIHLCITVYTCTEEYYTVETGTNAFQNTRSSILPKNFFTEAESKIPQKFQYNVLFPTS